MTLQAHKKAVIYDEAGKPGHINCSCGERITITIIAGMPMEYVCGTCGTTYDSRGWITGTDENIAALYEAGKAGKQ